MSWNFRLVKGISDSFYDPEGLECTLCEVYYNYFNEPVGYTNHSIVAESCDPDDLLQLQAMIDGAFDKDVLIFPEEFVDE